MDIFAFREERVAEHERFSRSVSKIRAEDISREVDAAHAAGHFWPAPLIQLNPNFEPAEYIDDLVADGTLDAECAKVFRLKRPGNTFGERLLLHRHQTDAIGIAGQAESYVLATGTWPPARAQASRSPTSFPSSTTCCGGSAPTTPPRAVRRSAARVIRPSGFSTHARRSHASGRTTRTVPPTTSPWSGGPRSTSGCARDADPVSRAGPPRSPCSARRTRWTADWSPRSGCARTPPAASSGALSG